MTDVNLAPQAMANVRIASVTAEKDEAQTSAAGRIEELGRQLSSQHGTAERLTSELDAQREALEAQREALEAQREAAQ